MRVRVSFSVMVRGRFRSRFRISVIFRVRTRVRAPFRVNVSFRVNASVTSRVPLFLNNGQNILE